MTHTPTPWHQGGIESNDKHWMRDIRSIEGRSIAWLGGFPRDQAIIDAAHIVHCVNSHDELVRQRDVLQAERDALQAKLQELEQQEPVASRERNPSCLGTRIVNWVIDEYEPLYAQQVPAAQPSNKQAEGALVDERWVAKLSTTDNPRNFSNPAERIAYQLGWNDRASAAQNAAAAKREG